MNLLKNLLFCPFRLPPQTAHQQPRAPQRRPLKIMQQIDGYEPPRKSRQVAARSYRNELASGIDQRIEMFSVVRLKKTEAGTIEDNTCHKGMVGAIVELYCNHAREIDAAEIEVFYEDGNTCDLCTVSLHDVEFIRQWGESE